MEAQTLHYGHVNLLTQMLCSTATKPIVAIGSCRKFGIPGHPFTFEQRKEMIQTVFGQTAFRFVELDDIDSSVDNDEWWSYVIGRITSRDMRSPTDCFCGSRYDAKWYEAAFAQTHEIEEIIVETTTAASTIYENLETGQRLHIVDRSTSKIPSGRDIRFLIERRDEDWKRFIPEVLHLFIETNYPPHLRQALRGPSPPNELNYPVGTRFIARDNPNIVLELKDDRKWRPLPAKDEKGDFARALHDQHKPI
jgi:hypothetical protein